jgi:hypothetical protein
MAIIVRPSASPTCSTCGYKLWTEVKMGKEVATHPFSPSCPDSHKAFEIPSFECKPLDDIYASDQV